MSERLEEFRRQRALQQEHLNWLDREIATLQGTKAPSPSPSPPPIEPEPSPRQMADADAILEEYRQPAVSIEKRTKTGCLLYFAAALVLTALFVMAVYAYSRAKRGH